MTDKTCIYCKYCVLNHLEPYEDGYLVEGYCELKHDEDYEDFDFKICEYFEENPNTIKVE